MSKSRVFDAVLKLTDKFSGPLKQVETHLDNFQKHYKDTAKGYWSTGKKLENAGKGWMKAVTLPIAGIAAGATASFNEVDEAMDTIVKKTGATGDKVKGFETIFKDLSRKIPVDMQKVGDSIGEVNTQFGFVGNELNKASEQFIKFSEINDADVSNSAIKAKMAMEAYGLENKDLNNILDSVTKTAQNTGQATDKIFDSVIRGAPQIKDLKLDFSQASEMIGRFEQSGIDSSKALSYMSKAQVNFAKDGKSLSDGLVDLQKKLDSSKDNTEKLSIASEIFGTKGASFMLDALERGAFNFDDFAKASENAKGAVSGTFEEALDPIDKFKGLMNSLKIVGSELFEASEGVWAPLLEKVIGKVKDLSDWFSSLSDEQKENIVKWAGMAASVGPVLIGLGKLNKGIGKVFFNLSDFAVAVKDAGSITKWFGGTGIGKFGKLFGKAGKGVGKLVMKLGSFVAGLGPVGWAIMAVIAVIILLILNWDKVKKVVTKVTAVVKKKFGEFKESASETVGKVIEFFSNGKERFFEILQSIHVFFVNAKDKFFEILNSIITFISETFKTGWENAWNGIKSIFTGIFEGIKSIFTGVINGITSGINTVISGVNKVKIPDWVPGIGGKGINIPLIPQLAKGTDFWTGGIVQVHEKGGEIIDLPRGSRVMPHDRSVKEAYTMGKSEDNNSGDQIINIPKLADQIIIREDADIDKIMRALAKELKIAKMNKIGGRI